MAGNPFRRPVTVPRDVSISEREAAADLSVDISGSITKPKKVVKRVRIQSPVTSPDEAQSDPFDVRLNDGGHPASPPPPDQESNIAIELRKSFIDSVARGASNLNRDAIGLVPSQTQPEPSGTDKAMSSGVAASQKAPYNPFARTLASIEGGYGTPAPAPGPAAAAATTLTSGVKTTDVSSNPQGGSVMGKPAMDVDSFTRMLLNGTSAPTAAPSEQPVSAPILSAEGSSTENSSISRHSVFEPVHGIQPESPPSSYEDSRSDDGPVFNEHSSLVADSQPKKPKPPPPSHHRGKLLSKKVPQTVPFADFEAFTPESVRPVPAPPSPGIAQPTPSNTQSDLNKPLPPAPEPPFPDATTELNVSETTQPTSITEDDLQPKKLRPPPPPVSRRTSLRIDGRTGRPRSSSNLSKTSVVDDHDDSSAQLPQSKPPPPPSRRAATSISSVDRDASITPSIQEDIEAPLQTSTKAPPPPPSRQALRGAPPLARTSSNRSISSTTHRRTSPSTAQAPPPPPPRRGDKRSSFDGSHFGPTTRRPSDGSQRSSIELRRSSGASFNHPRTPSITSLQNVPEGESGQDTSISDIQPQESGKDILADLSAFQAEIDALRAQIGK